MLTDFAKAYRGDFLESIHSGTACLYSKQASIKFFGVQQDFSTFTRSIIKIIQAKVAKSILGDELNEELLALACASHLADEQQMKFIYDIKNKFELDEKFLQCGDFSQSRRQLASPLMHNCSGKHLALLAACKKQGWDLNTYLAADHPLTKLVDQEVYNLSGTDELPSAIDGCGLKTYYMKLSDMAKMFCELIEDPAYQEIIAINNKYPFLIGGAKQIDSLIMHKYPGKFFCKGGAEGLIMLANLQTKECLIVKIIDGADRAKGVALVNLAEQLKWLDAEQIGFSKNIYNSKKEIVGKIISDFKL